MPEQRLLRSGLPASGPDWISGSGFKNESRWPSHSDERLSGVKWLR